MLSLFCFNGVEQVAINEDPATVLANNDLLALLDLALALRRNRVKATATGITLNGNYRKPVTVILTDTIIRMQEAWFHFLSCFC